MADSPDLLIQCSYRTEPSTNITGHTLLAHLISKLLSNYFPPGAWEPLRWNVLIALHKDPNDLTKLRPIGIGLSLRRLIARHIVQNLSVKIAHHMLPFQFALGSSGGTEILTHIIMEALDTSLYQNNHTNPYAALKLDFINMFNNISRKAVLEELEEHFPELVYIFMQLYPSEGNTVWIELPDHTWQHFPQKEGFAQGCPFAPFFSCLALVKLMRGLDETLKARQARSQQQNTKTPTTQRKQTQTQQHV